MTNPKMPELYPRAWEIRWPSKEDGFDNVKYHGTNAIADYRVHVHPEAYSRALVCKDEAIKSMRIYGQACWDAARVVDDAMVQRAIDSWFDLPDYSGEPDERLRMCATLQAALGGDDE